MIRDFLFGVQLNQIHFCKRRVIKKMISRSKLKTVVEAPYFRFLYYYTPLMTII